MELKKPKKWYFVDNMHSKVRCDNEGCDWEETTWSFDQLFDWLNVPCPKCNGPLPIITEADLRSTLLLNAILGNPIIRFLNWVGKKTGTAKTYRTEWSRKGDGHFDLKEVDYGVV
jgi:hypothetical protein